MSSIKHQGNCINTFRLLAAVQVMWGHITYHLGISGKGYEYIGELFNIFLGVPVFFFLSGYLIWISLKRDIDKKEYFLNRFLRIYPELWICVAIEVATIIVFYTNIDWIKLGLFTFTQATIFQFWTPEFLRGYGCGTPNGALWTICVTVQFYILIWGIRIYLNNRTKRFWVILFGALVIIAVASVYMERILPAIVHKLLFVSVIPYLWMFWIGIIIAEFDEEIRNICMKYWYILLVFCIALRIIRCDVYAKYPILLCVFSFFVLIGIAYRFPSANFKTDISYAVFIYHMIFVNIAIVMGMQGTSSGVFFVIASTGIVSWISTVVIGNRMNRIKAERKRQKKLVVEGIFNG